MGSSIELISSDTGAVTAPRTPGMVSDGTVHYDTVTDELYIGIGGSTMVCIRPGKSVAEAIAGVMTQAAEVEHTPVRGGDIQPCEHCGEDVRAVESGLGSLLLDAKPSESGIYVMTSKPGTVRTLRPLETPVASTYRKHVCKNGGSTT